jgi:DNA-binding MarR family transcriptional regulator
MSRDLRYAGHMADEVDGIAAAWLAERPDLDVEPLHILSRIGRLAQLLDERRAQAFAEHGLASHEFDVLAALRRSGRPYQRTPGQLIEATHVTSGTMTNRLDRLADRNLVIRKAHPEDGRQVLIRLTALGKRRVDAAMEELLASERALLGGLSAAQRTSLAAGLRRLLSTLAAG